MPTPRNGTESPPTPHPRIPSHNHHAQSIVTFQKLRRFNALILVFRLVTFCFSLSSFVFMLTISGHSGSPSWHHFNAFRFVLAANAIVAVYSMLELGAVVWEISRATTVLPETLQVWLDFSHDQAFGYMTLAADAAGAELALRLRQTEMCASWSSFCVQADISVALGFVGFLFLALSSLLSGFRAVSFFIHGSRFHV